MKNMLLPDIFTDTVFDIDMDYLKSCGIKGLIFDIDNTLATYDDKVADEKTANWLNSLREEGFGLYIVSNNDKERVRIFSEDLGIPYFGKGLKPLGKYLRKACRQMGIKTHEAALIGDQLFTDMYGGNRLKMKTILVKPISDIEDGFVHFKRQFERRILKKHINKGV